MSTNDECEALAYGLVTVTEQDRLTYCAYEKLSPACAKRALSGEMDQVAGMQIIARHRLAAIEEAAKVASKYQSESMHPMFRTSQIIVDQIRNLGGVTMMAPQPPAPGGEGDVTLHEAATDLLRAMHDDQKTVGYRLDLWNCLQASLANHSPDAGGVGERKAIVKWMMENYRSMAALNMIDAVDRGDYLRPDPRGEG